MGIIERVGVCVCLRMRREGRCRRKREECRLGRGWGQPRTSCAAESRRSATSSCRTAAVLASPARIRPWVYSVMRPSSALERPVESAVRCRKQERRTARRASLKCRRECCRSPFSAVVSTFLSETTLELLWDLREIVPRRHRPQEQREGFAAATRAKRRLERGVRSRESL